MRIAAAACLLASTTALAAPISSGDVDTSDPAVGAIITSAGNVMCTATAIGPHTVITAAHCVVRDPTTLRVFFGNVAGEDGWLIPVSDARAHPGFDPGGRDIALMTLRASAPVTPLALEGPLNAALVGDNVRIVGFGLTGLATADEGIKRVGTARIASMQPEELIAVPDPSLPCMGDSGGPALLASGTIVGVVSRSDSTCIDHAVYTRIDAAQTALIVPYLAETALGAAQEGEPCFYDGHCAAGLDCVGDVERTCEAAAGCGCTSGGSLPVPLVLVVALAFVRRRRLSGRVARRS